MEFTTLSFGFFLTFLFLLYWSVAKKFQTVLLLLASIYFYISWRPAYWWLIFVTTGIVYITGLLIEKNSQYKKTLLFLSITANLAVLFLFKYLNFFDYTVSSTFTLFNLNLSLPQFKVLLPIGISFYTFQLISYLINVYTGKTKAEKNLLDFSLFVLFFPKLIAGPIEQTAFLQQIHKEKNFDYDRTVSGLKLFTLGLFKKVVIADNLAVVVNRVFDALPEYKGLSLILAIFFFSWQIYADFSGYTDMARGVARMLGFSLLENFEQPYFATSVRDFWRRWHMSLSSWLKDYVYIPLGGSRRGIILTCINGLIVFTICGIWHGAALTFVVWGLFHGIIISLERIAAHITQGKINVPRWISMPYTYAVICISWVLFRAETLSDALYIFKNSLVGVKNFILPNYLFATLSKLFVTNTIEMMIALFCVLTFIVIDLLLVQKKSIQHFFNSRNIVIRFGVYIAVVMIIILLRNSTITEFIYVQF